MLNNSAPFTSVKHMKNKHFLIATSLIAMSFFSGCASVEWREGSIFERNGGVRSPQTAQTQPQETRPQETRPQETRPQETQQQEQEQPAPEVVFVDETPPVTSAEPETATSQQPEDASIDKTAIEEEVLVSENTPLPEAAPNKVLTPAPYPSRELNASDMSLRSALETVMNSGTAKSDIPRQIQALEQLHQANPGSSGVLYHLGRLAFFNEQPQEAINYLQQALKLEDENFYAANLLGLVYRSQGQFNKAEASYRTALNIWPDYATAWYNLGILQDLYRNDLANALVSYKNYLAILESKSANGAPGSSSDDKTRQNVELWVKDLEMRLSSQSK